MWAVVPLPATVCFPNQRLPFSRCPVVTLARSQNDGVGGLGHIFLTTTNSDEVISNTNSISNRQKQKQGEGNQLSGSDVLWALQRAAVQKKKKHKKRRELKSAGTGSDKEDADVDDHDVDYSNVKPLDIKSEWSVKLNELEKRLQELSEI
ncbi:uncharacterized protein LOC123217042 [Mangifera indica]|uniref:uncharacterized protein LOC123217042 n=1 Tax=Mangifera indica TaxID=29780 RepID=UPI001CFB78C1|nr:uncharacterized protein LOC123217042 [Mangifera indica]